MRRALAAVAAAALMVVPASSSAARRAPGPAPLTGPLRVMTVGDSRTEGGSAPYTGDADRWELLADLIFVDQLYGSTFVGDHTTGPSGLATAGHSGWTVTKVHAWIAAWIAAYQPNVILLEIGVNDARNGASGDAIAAGIGALLDTALTADPDLRVIVADILPPFYGTQNDVASVAAARANELLPAVVQAAGDRVTLARMSAAISTKFLPDGLHLSQEGYYRRGYVWHECLRRLTVPGAIRSPKNPFDVPVPLDVMCPARS